MERISEGKFKSYDTFVIELRNFDRRRQFFQFLSRIPSWKILQPSNRLGKYWKNDQGNYTVPQNAEKGKWSESKAKKTIQRKERKNRKKGVKS